MYGNESGFPWNCNHGESAINVKGEHGSICYTFCFIGQFEAEEAKKGYCDYLHLPISKVLPQTDSRTSLQVAQVELLVVVWMVKICDK